VEEHVTFSGLRLTTQPGRVMTPRPATEELAARALELVGGRRARVVDVGTGSGAIAIAVAAAAPQAEVWATDTSRWAVALAQLNVRRQGLADQVIVRHGDLLAPVPGPVDLIVANLPYLPAADVAQYPDLAAEPGESVFAGGDGLDPYRRLLAVSAERLTSGGGLVFQLDRRVVSARRDELNELRRVVERAAQTRVRNTRLRLTGAAA
jgi:release factor glutamine methyltransferase